jgi:hypothetical protein
MAQLRKESTMTEQDFEYWLKIYSTWLDTNPPMSEVAAAYIQNMDDIKSLKLYIRLPKTQTDASN